MQASGISKGMDSVMRRPSVFLGALLGGLTSLPLIALSYLGQQWAGLPFIPFDLFDWLARVLPGRLITVVIDTMVRIITLLGIGPISSAAKRMEQLQGILFIVGGGVVFGAIIALVIRLRNWSGSTVGLAAGLLVFMLAAAMEISLGGPAMDNPAVALLWLAILIVGWGTLLGTWLSVRQAPDATPATTEEFRAARRALLLEVAGGSIGLALATWGLTRLLEAQRAATGAGQALPAVPAALPAPAGTATPAAAAGTATPVPQAAGATRDRVPPAPGTRPELTSNANFYRIDIDALPPVIEKSSWVLAVDGLFDHARPLTLSDILAYPAITQPITLSCISNPIGGDLISTSNWTGVRLRDLLKDLGLRPEAKELAIKAADRFYESVVMEDMLDPRTLLVYGMNGETLPIEHGFPLRIYIPNHYGMKQPKWIVSIEAIDHHGPGYWVDRGWSPTAYPQVISVIDTVAKDHIENGRVPVGGIAWAGDRGIQKVEVQVDGGAWAEAILRTPPLSGLTWVQWRYDWPVTAGEHTFRVRATDGMGTLQTEAESDTYPNGATGYHSVTATL
jgi:DMSO/TMAO reductase YedYZ molybdopterin-dependent catalytic subunit